MAAAAESTALPDLSVAAVPVTRGAFTDSPLVDANQADNSAVVTGACAG